MDTERVQKVCNYTKFVYRDNIYTGESVGASVPTRSGKTLVAAKHKVGYVDWRTGSFETVAEVDHDKPTTRFNDGKCDSSGRVWAGTYVCVYVRLY